MTFNKPIKGFVWTYFVASHDLPRELQMCVLRPEGTMVVQVRETMEMQSLLSFGIELKKLGRLPQAN